MKKPVRRQSLIKELPRRASIPKFLSSQEIHRVKAIKEENPQMEWEDVIQKVVLESVTLPVST